MLGVNNSTKMRYGNAIQVADCFWVYLRFSITSNLALALNNLMVIIL